MSDLEELLDSFEKQEDHGEKYFLYYGDVDPAVAKAEFDTLKKIAEEAKKAYETGSISFGIQGMKLMKLVQEYALKGVKI